MTNVGMQRYRPLSNLIEGWQSSPPCGSLGDRRHSPQVGYDSIDVIRRHRRVVLIAHRRFERAAVLADTRSDGALDLLVAPAPDPLGLARCDVARDGDAPRAAEFKTASAKAVPLTDALLHGGVTFHAMRDCDEIKAFLDLVLHRVFGEGLLAARNYHFDLRHLIDRVFNLVADGLKRAQIRNDGVEITLRHDVIETRGHDHCDMHAVRPYAGAHDGLDFRIGPGPDARFLVLGDVWRCHLERWLVPGKASRIILAGDGLRWTFWRMAIAACQDAVDQIIATLDQIGSRRLRIGHSHRGGSNCRRQQYRPNYHERSPRLLIGCDHNCDVDCGKQKGAAELPPL